MAGVPVDARHANAPVGDAPVGDAPVGDAPVGDAPVGDAPANFGRAFTARQGAVNVLSQAKNYDYSAGASSRSMLGGAAPPPAKKAKLTRAVSADAASALVSLSHSSTPPPPASSFASIRRFSLPVNGFADNCPPFDPRRVVAAHAGVRRGELADPTGSNGAILM